jgi:hypothetical protein
MFCVPIVMGVHPVHVHRFTIVRVVYVSSDLVAEFRQQMLFQQYHVSKGTEHRNNSSS